MVTYKRIFTGNNCNNNCLYCNYRHTVKSNPDLTEIAANMADNNKFDSIEFYGGEPTIRDDFIGILNIARQNGFRRIKILTNGRIFSDIGMAIQAVESGCHLFEIKVHGSNPHIHDAITRADGSFWQTIHGIQNLRSIDVVNDAPFCAFIGVRIPICKENYMDVENTVINLLQFKVDRIILSFDDDAIALGNVLSHIQNAINISILNRVWILTQKIPLCVMEGFEHHVSEVYAISENRLENHKNCANCVYGEICPGMSVEYFKNFGFRELQYIRESKHLDDIYKLRNEEN